MKIKKKDLYRLWPASTFYIFMVLYVQVLEVLLPFSVTKFFVLLLLISILVGVVKKTISIDKSFVSAAIVFLFFLFFYYVYKKELFSFVYPGVIVVLYACLLLANEHRINENTNKTLGDRFILGYLIVNVMLYFSKESVFFQMDQFKGALPHTNMLGSILLSLFIIEFWSKGIIVRINQILITVILLFTQSRTYLLMIIAIWLLIIAGIVWKKVHFLVKAIIGSVFLALFGNVIFERLIELVPGLSRFQSFRFSGNGRQILNLAYSNTIAKSSFLDMIKGYPMADKYTSGISVDFHHSFTENSYYGFFLLFGLIGFGFLVFLLIRMLLKRASIQNVFIMLFALVTLFFQDTLLSVQTGIILMYALTVSNEEYKQLKTINNNNSKETKSATYCLRQKEV